MRVKYMRVTCPECGWIGNYTLEDLEKTLKKLKMDKVFVVAKQMQQKSGPFYDRWLLAMEARGEQKRCKDCLGFFPYSAGNGYNFCGYKGETVTPGRFACKRFV